MDDRGRGIGERAPGADARAAAGDPGPGTSERLRIGLNLPTWPLADGRYATWPEMRALAREAEALGVDTIWAPDHLQRRLPGRPTIGFRECWTIVTAAAEATSAIEVGTFVANTAFRNPGLLARMAATLDEVSGGRVVLGLGSGVPATDDSWRAFGFDPDRHVSRHAEAVEAIARLLREGSLTYTGAFVRLDGAEMIPPGPRSAGLPIWIAAKGERTMELAARFGDAVNVNQPLAGADDAADVVARAAAACAVVGRDPGTLQVTGWVRLALRPDGSADARPGWLGGSPEHVAATLAAIHRAGVVHVTVYVGDHDDPSPLPALTRTTLEKLVPILEGVRTA